MAAIPGRGAAAPRTLDGANALHDGEVVYYRCRAEEKVPHQEAAWRTAAFAIGPVEAASLNAILEPSHAVHVAARYFHAADPGGRPQDLSAWPVLEQISQFHREAIVTGALQGDDWGTSRIVRHTFSARIGSITAAQSSTSTTAREMPGCVRWRYAGVRTSTT